MGCENSEVVIPLPATTHFLDVSPPSYHLRQQDLLIQRESTPKRSGLNSQLILVAPVIKAV